MKSSTRALVLSAFLAAVSAACNGADVAAPEPSLAKGGAGGGASQTAQGIMVNLDASGTFAVSNHKTYRFNTATAANFYNNVWNGVAATAICTGSPANCAVTNQPATPATPAADASQIVGRPAGPGQADQDKCTFLDGGALGSRVYTQFVTINGVNGGGNWKFTWGYTVTPTQATVDALTAWDLESETGGTTAHIDVDVMIAGESVVANQQNPTGKYSFSLRNGDGTNRVANVVLTVDGTPYPLVVALQENCPGCIFGALGAVDFAYATNAGTNGVLSLLKNADARSILNGDTFAGNNNGGADGSALARAVAGQGLELAPGSHTIKLTGIVKGNGAETTDQSFTITQNLLVLAPGCGVVQG
jgi:hypothetical protein